VGIYGQTGRGASDDCGGGHVLASGVYERASGGRSIIGKVARRVEESAPGGAPVEEKIIRGSGVGGTPLYWRGNCGDGTSGTRWEGGRVKTKP